MRLIKRSLEYFLTIIFSSLVICVLWQVFSRYAINSPSTVTEELSRFLLIWLTIFGATYTFFEKGHLALELLAEKLNNPLWLERVTYFSILFFSLLFIIGGMNLVISNWNLGQTTAVLGIPMAIIYVAAPINGVLILYFACHELVKGGK